jgi:hypothetical protein
MRGVEQFVGLGKPDAFVLANAAEVLAARPPDQDYLRNCERPSGGKPIVEIVRGKPAVELEDDWRELLDRADAPNVFMQPRVLRAAAPERRLATLLAWEPRGRGRRLVGFWGFSIGRPHLSLLPITALCGPATDHAYLSAPVIDRDRLDATLHAMLDAIAEAPDLPKFVALESMSGSGATYDALIRVLTERESRFCQLDAKNRPLLMPGSDRAGYLEKVLSSSSRKKLRQHRRRLAQKGRLETTVARSAADVRRAFETFLTLEAEGWKGRRCTAMACCPDDAVFSRNLVAALAQTGDACVYALELDGRPVSMQVVLRAGPAAYTWKTAYDETLGDFSPGMLLFEDYSKALLGDSNVAFADSCAYDDSGYMAAWTERKLIVDFWLDARRGASARFSTVARLQKVYLPLREAAKKAYRGSAIAQTFLRNAKALRQVLSKRGVKPAPTNEHLAAASRT